MWTVVYISQVEKKARELAGLLCNNDIISRVRNVNCGNENGCFEVLVPQTELDIAQDLIFENEF
ncbi:MAG: glutamate decarboxylase [Clostridia bacterium]